MPNSTKKIIRNGTHYSEKENKLTLFTFPNFINVLYGYPKWRAFYCDIRKNEWHPCRPETDIYKNMIMPVTGRWKKERAIIRGENIYHYRNFEDEQLYLPFEEMEKKFAGKNSLKWFFNTIPAELKCLAARFPVRQWSIISSSIFNPIFCELLQSNPVLAYVLANIWVFNNEIKSGRQNVFLKRHISQKQRNLLKIAGYPDNERMVRIFKKISPEYISVKNLYYLRSILNNTEYSKRAEKLLCHIPEIKGIMILLVTNKNILELLSNRFITVISRNKSLYLDYSFYLKILNLINDAKYLDIKLPVIDSISGFIKAFTEFGYIITDIEDRKILGSEFPEPPLEESETIKALRNPKQLIKWSYHQGNCIKNYADSVLKGYNYYYSIDACIKTATLELLMQNDMIKATRLLGRFNTSCDYELTERVKKWFLSHFDKNGIQINPIGRRFTLAKNPVVFDEYSNGELIQEEYLRDDDAPF